MEFNLTFWIIQTVAMMITAFLLPGLTVSGPIPAFATVAVLGLINAHLWDASLFFNIPQSFGAPALMVLLANALIFWIVVKILPGIEVRGILPAIAAPLVFTITSALISRYEPMVDWSTVAQRAGDAVATLRDSMTSARDSMLAEQSKDAAPSNDPARAALRP